MKISLSEPKVPRFACVTPAIDRIVFTAEGVEAARLGFSPEDARKMTSEILAAARAVEEANAKRRGDHVWASVAVDGGCFLVRHRQQECRMRPILNGKRRGDRGWSCTRCGHSFPAGVKMYVCEGKPRYLPGVIARAIHDWKDARLCEHCVRPAEGTTTPRTVLVVPFEGSA